MLALPTLRWISSPNYSSRNGQKVRDIIVHDCQGSYAGAVFWFAERRSQVSAHIVLREDGLEATQMVRFANKAWHACAFNSVSEGLEMAGFAAQGFESAQWRAAAAIVAFRLHVNGLPCRWAERGEGEGFCSHYDLGAAGGGHTDPTTDPATWRMFCGLVAEAYSQEPPVSWPITTNGVPAAKPSNFAPSNDSRADEPFGSIAWAQMRLNALHATVRSIPVDGLDGRRTEDAVRQFQETHGLFVDGILGPQTLAALAS